MELKVEVARAAATVERLLHDHVRVRLIEKYGPDEDGWWVQGIKKPIRKKCNDRREEETRFREEPYSYADLIDFKEILDAEWAVFQADFANLNPGYAAKKELLDDLVRFNDLRHLVHGCRLTKPTQEDIEFIEQFSATIREFSDETTG